MIACHALFIDKIARHMVYLVNDGREREADQYLRRIEVGIPEEELADFRILVASFILQQKEVSQYDPD